MSVQILVGDCRDRLKELPDESVQCVVTSPPYYGLRDYGHGDQIGLEETPEQYVAAMVDVFREVRRVLREDGVVWLNIGDSYANTKVGNTNEAPDKRPRPYFENGTHLMEFAKKVPEGLKPKDLIGIPWRLAFALQAGGWWLRSDVIWHKPNPMPESVTDRPTKAHEYLFLLSKNERYFYDHEAIKEPFSENSHAHGAGGDFGRASPNGTPTFQSKEAGRTGQGRNKRSVWTIATKPFSEAHFAVMPPDLVEPCIKAGSREGDTVLDPFGGAGTVGLVADRLKRHAILVELNENYAEMSRKRIIGDAPLLASVKVE